MEETKTEKVNEEQTSEQSNTKAVQDKPELNWKDKFVIYFGIVIVIVFGVFVLKALTPTDHKPSEILTNPEEHSILFKWGLLWREL